MQSSQFKSVLLWRTNCHSRPSLRCKHPLKHKAGLCCCCPSSLLSHAPPLSPALHPRYQPCACPMVYCYLWFLQMPSYLLVILSGRQGQKNLLETIMPSHLSSESNDSRHVNWCSSTSWLAHWGRKFMGPLSSQDLKHYLAKKLL